MNDSASVLISLEDEITKELPKKRFEHTMNVVEKSLEMAEKYDANKLKAKIIALAHDRFRDTNDIELNNLILKYEIDKKYMNNNDLAHGPVAAAYVKEKYGIEDDDIINGIKYHTTGRKDMSIQEKIIFLADAIEKSRNYPGVSEIRAAAEQSLDCAVKESLQRTVNHLEKEGRTVDKHTLEALSDYKED